MPASAIALLFLSASLHTLWNLLLKQSRQKVIASWWIVTIGAILFMPGLFFTGMPPREIWHFALISAGLEATYMLTLSQAYKNSDFSLVYPMARGTAPAFLLLWSLLFLHEKLTGWGFLGLVMIIGGLILTGTSSLIQNWKNIPNIKGIAAALATAFFISVYTFVDGIAVKRAPAVSYGLLMFTLIPFWLTPFVLKKLWVVAGDWRMENPTRQIFDHRFFGCAGLFDRPLRLLVCPHQLFGSHPRGQCGAGGIGGLVFSQGKVGFRAAGRRIHYLCRNSDDCATRVKGSNTMRVHPTQMAYRNTSVRFA